MAEKRKPCLILMLRTPGKIGRKWNKVELFRGDQWEGFTDDLKMPLRPGKHKLYRIRINGKWNDKMNEKNRKWFTKWQFRDLLFRSIRF